MTKRRTTDSFIEESREIHGGFYDYEKTDYQNNKKKVIVTCPIHGDFEVAPSSHLKGIQCQKCALNARKSPNLSQEEIIQRFREVHGEHYDYSLVEFKGVTQKVNIICPEHGSFWMTPHNHTNGKQGCPLERYQKVSISKSMKQDEFECRIPNSLKTTFDFSDANYTGRSTPVKVFCKTHGEFFQKPVHIWRGQIGCKECSDKSSSREKFTKKAAIVHDSKYDYSEVVYKKAHQKVTIVCSKHGEFRQAPTNHLGERGCPKCANSGISRAEEEIACYLNELDINHLSRNNKQIISPYELDIYLPDYQIAIEYCGLYWHSSAVGKDQSYHLKKHQLCEKNGIRLITIFEDEWLKKKDIVKSVLRHIVNKSPKGVYARDTTINEISWGVAKPFLEKHHLLGCGSSGTVRLGAFGFDGSLIAVMVFGKPSDERGQVHFAEMKRFVTDGRNHPGLGSKMASWYRRNYEQIPIRAFVDRRWFIGTFKFHSGFKILRYTEPSLFYVNHENRYHRRHLTKKNLIESGGNPHLTKKHLMEEIGYYQIWDCGKILMELK